MARIRRRPSHPPSRRPVTPGPRLQAQIHTTRQTPFSRTRTSSARQNGQKKPATQARTLTAPLINCARLAAWLLAGRLCVTASVFEFSRPIPRPTRIHITCIISWVAVPRRSSAKHSAIDCPLQAGKTQNQQTLSPQHVCVCGWV